MFETYTINIIFIQQILFKICLREFEDDNFWHHINESSKSTAFFFTSTAVMRVLLTICLPDISGFTFYIIVFYRLASSVPQISDF